MKSIYTVVIITKDDELSTVSFTDLDKAIDYCLDEIESHTNGEFYPSTTRLRLNEDKYFIDDDGSKYYIEEAKLVY